jgi:7-cyano-7-deazaguanine synthase
MSFGRALVLLSGGADSTAALHWALAGYAEVHAIGFDYGQPHHAELCAAEMIAARRGVPFTRRAIGDAIHGGAGLCVPKRGANENGVSRASIPLRNGAFVMMAAIHAAQQWPADHTALVIGCNSDDTPTFPDTRLHFLRAVERAAAIGLIGVAGLSVDAPWVERGMRKLDVVRWCSARPVAAEDIADSLSCYHGTHCGACDACSLRAFAFATAGIVDRRRLPHAIGEVPR